MAPHSWIIECLDLFGGAENIKGLLVNSLEGDSLDPLVFVLALIPLDLILKKAKAAYEFSESQEKINHLLFMDDWNFIVVVRKYWNY